MNLVWNWFVFFYRRFSRVVVKIKPSPIRLTIGKRSLFTSKQKEQNSNQHQQQQQQQQGRQSKGKFNKIQRKWSWKAGAGWTILSVLDWWLLAAGGWLTWRGVFLRWTPIGICMIAAAQWHLHNRELDRKGLPRTAASWQVRTIRPSIVRCS